MTRDERERAEGYTSLDMVESEYHIPAADFEAAVERWQKGAAFFRTTSIYNETCIIKLAKCISVSLLTPESVAERERQTREAKEREALA